MSRFKMSKTAILGVTACLITAHATFASSASHNHITGLSQKPLSSSFELAQTTAQTEAEIRSEERRKAREERKRKREQRRKQRSRPRFGSFS